MQYIYVIIFAIHICYIEYRYNITNIYIYIYILFETYSIIYIMDGESLHKRASTGTLGQGPGEMGELIDTPAGAEKLKGMRP